MTMMIGQHILDVFNNRLIEVMKTGQAELMQKITIKGRVYLNRSPIIKDGKIIGAVAVQDSNWRRSPGNYIM